MRRALPGITNDVYETAPWTSGKLTYEQAAGHASVLQRESQLFFEIKANGRKTTTPVNCRACCERKLCELCVSVMVTFGVSDRRRFYAPVHPLPDICRCVTGRRPPMLHAQ